jgi:phage shock protein A
LYEQGLREEGAREANEKIASLETQAQRLGAENKVLQEDNERMQVRIQELEAQLAQKA